MMNVGLPGTGLGGMFYLTIALITPLCEAVRTLRYGNGRQRWSTVGKMTLTSLSIFAAMWLTAIGIVALMPKGILSSFKENGAGLIEALGASPTAITFLTLVGVLVLLEAIAIINMAIKVSKQRLAETA